MQLVTSNPNLEAEESDSYNLGAIWNINDNIVASLDWYSLEISNLQGRITSITN